MSTSIHLNLLKGAGLKKRFGQVKTNDMYFKIKKVKTQTK